jgi:hypothetical protein
VWLECCSDDGQSRFYTSSCPTCVSGSPHPTSVRRAPEKRQGVLLKQQHPSSLLLRLWESLSLCAAAAANPAPQTHNSRSHIRICILIYISFCAHKHTSRGVLFYTGVFFVQAWAHLLAYEICCVIQNEICWKWNFSAQCNWKSFCFHNTAQK